MPFLHDVYKIRSVKKQPKRELWVVKLNRYRSETSKLDEELIRQLKWMHSINHFPRVNRCVCLANSLSLKNESEDRDVNVVDTDSCEATPA